MERWGQGRAGRPATTADDFLEFLGFCTRMEALIAELLLLSDRGLPQLADHQFDPVLLAEFGFETSHMSP
ncbi:hypothetical protein E2562_016933 [Oryza meyeriana var. granulata]|uniref:Uncharacterized protein n=1 Tax=Oryza meyeriana var. granulata TaxID=110450 RepID=A0A6G1DY39_9ORYZ|nr:hypothetical protein E2562_016933 [Oryza meyeriana var. granulata]